MSNSRTFILAALLVCCGAAASGALHRFGRMQCPRYFGCTPAHRPAVGFTQD